MEYKLPKVGDILDFVPGYTGYQYEIIGYFERPKYAMLFSSETSVLKSELLLQLKRIKFNVLWELLIVILWQRRADAIKVIIDVRGDFIKQPFYRSIMRSYNMSLYKFILDSYPEDIECIINCAIFVSVRAIDQLIKCGCSVGKDYFKDAILMKSYDIMVYFIEELNMRPTELDINNAIIENCDIRFLHYLMDYAPKSSSYYMSCIRNIDMVILLYARDNPVNESITRYAINTGSEEVVEYFCEMGCPFNYNVCTGDKWINKILHKYGVGVYSKGCLDYCGDCCIYKNEKIENLWIMEVDYFENYIQWLPREIVDDVIEIISNDIYLFDGISDEDYYSCEDY